MIGIVKIVISNLIWIFSRGSYLSFAPSVAVIGGADGPTAVFVTVSPSNNMLICFGAIIITAIIAIFIIAKRKSKK